MTEQVLNNPEMKTIMLLSGYIRELSEGADYETTTYKYAETIAKVFYVSRREQLIAFANYCKKEWNCTEVPTDVIDEYLENN